jgi:hypothetical protein
MNSNIRHAALTLEHKLRQYTWFQFIGIGQDEILVYVNKAGQQRFNRIDSLIPKTWEGIPVTVRITQKPVPLTVTASVS